MKDEQDEKERKEREAEEKKAKEEEDKKKSEEEDEEEEEEEEVGPGSLSLFEALSTLCWINLKTQFYFYGWAYHPLYCVMNSVFLKALLILSLPDDFAGKKLKPTARQKKAIFH